ncbi:ribosomal biogenesis protein LAS1L-like [Malaclemys terrapin pileata]|uniref:ribosomal biogenesis protein LAS1L-like n=1 Tax=Malaclemys terrapin pileata TaxID=2991368 RepID=UPI0023A87ED8|nr:ribosomal biogenesis protein LAS1L-like [Malaclemys terrapin pileata]
MDVLRRILRRKAPQVALEPEGGSCQHPQTESRPSIPMAWEAAPGHPRRWTCSALLTRRKPAPRAGAERRETTSRPRWRWPKFSLGRQDTAHGRNQARQLWVCFCWKASPQPSRVGQQEASPAQELGDRCPSSSTGDGGESSRSLEAPCNTEAEYSSTAEIPTDQSEKKDLAPEEKAEEDEDRATEGEEEEEDLETEEEEKQEEEVLTTEKEEVEDLAIKEGEDMTTEEEEDLDTVEKEEEENLSAEEEEEEENVSAEEEENLSAEEEEEELSIDEEEDLTTEKEEEEEGKGRGREGRGPGGGTSDHGAKGRREGSGHGAGRGAPA